MTGLGELRHVRLVYPKAFARHPTQHPFNSPRSELHDKCEPCNDDPSSGFRSAGPCCNLLGADSARQFSNKIAKTYGLDSFGTN